MSLLDRVLELLRKRPPAPALTERQVQDLARPAERHVLASTRRPPS